MFAIAPVAREAFPQVPNKNLDGVTTRVRGTERDSPDTDGDGLTDWEEVNIFYTDPTKADSNGNGKNDMYPVKGQRKAGTNTCHRAGTWADLWENTPEQNMPRKMDYVHEWYKEVPSWVEEGQTLCATNLARAEWEFAAPVAGMYRFGFCHRNACAGAPPPGYRYRLHFLVDHVRVQTLDVDAVSGTSVWKYVTTPWLTATNHHFRLVWVNWVQGGNTAFGVKEVGLFAVDGPDSNSNGRQDWVEEVLAQGKDTDGDGLTDLAEIDTHGTDPLNPDTDGDHLLDGEEVNLFGTDPRRADSDGDGVSDAEVLVEHDGTGTLSRVDAEQWFWAWWQLDSSLVAKWKGGTLTYAIPVRTGGIYRLGLQLRDWASEITDNWKFQVEVSVDDKLLKTLEIFADHDFSNTGYVNTDWLKAGDHSVRLKWVNSAWEHDPTLRSPNIRIEKVSLYAIHGPDKNGNGVQDWIENVQGEIAATKKAVVQELGLNIFDKSAKHQKMLELASLYRELKKYGNVDSSIKELLLEKPGPEIKSKAESLLAAAQKDLAILEKKVSSRKQAVNEHPDGFDEQMAMARAYEENKAYDNACEWYQKAALINPGAAVFSALGTAFAASQQREGDIEKLRKEILDFSEEKRVEHIRKATDDREMAKRVAELRKKLETSPGNGYLWKELGESLLAQNNYEEAIVACETAIQHAPNPASAERWEAELGQIFERRRDPRKVIDAYRRLIAGSPKVEYYEKLLKALQEANDVDGQINACLEFSKKYPDQQAKYQAVLTRAIGKRKQIEREAEASKPHIPP